MGRRHHNRSRVLLLKTAALAVCVFLGCGEKAPPADENLLRNGSFEDVQDGLPKHWEITNYRGLRDMEPSVYGVTDSVAHDGERSFFFKASASARRFYALSQEVRIRGARRVRVRGAIMGVGLGDKGPLHSQANFALTYYGPGRERFTSARFADVTTKAEFGTTDGWIQIDRVFRLPPDTELVVLHCVLGMGGTIWFDNVSLEVPLEPPWQSSEGENFTFYWLDEPYPEGSKEAQQRLFDAYASRLGIQPEDRVRISYYLYPDVETLRQMMGLRKGQIHADYERREIHSVDPVDDHEIIHMLTDPYGVMPIIMNEGTAFYLMGHYKGRSIQPLAQELLLADELPALKVVLDPSALHRVQPEKLIAAAASFAGYLLEIGGPAKYLELHGSTRADMAYEGFATAFQNVYGKRLVRAEAAWRRVLARADFSQETEPEE